MRGGERLWAIGDGSGIWPLTHVGEYDGDVVAANISGDPHPASYEAVPQVAYTYPQAAAVRAVEELESPVITTWPQTRSQAGYQTQPVEVQMSELPPPPEGIVLAHFIVSDDVERSRRFYTEVLGGRVVFAGDPIYVALSNSWIIINVGGGPTDDKPAVTLQTPREPDRVSSFLNIRVKDIEAVYAEWSARGAQFLTPPKQHQHEIRCYIRDPDGHLIEVGQTTDPERDWSPAHWPASAHAGKSE